jgi:hypothetical protein
MLGSTRFLSRPLGEAIMFNRVRQIALVAALAMAAPLALYSANAAPKPHKADARLHGYGGTKGKVMYVKQKKSGKTYESFKVQVKKGLPLQTYSVRVNGKHYGYLMTGPSGNGKFELRSKKFINSSANECYPMPKDFPDIDTGDVVEVGPCCGVSYDCGDKASQKYTCKGDLEGEYGQQGSVTYRERYKNGDLDRRFMIDVEGVGAYESLDVYVNDVYITTITADEWGEVELRYRTEAYINDGYDGEAMPDWFPTLQHGDVVYVGSMSATLDCLTDGNGNGGDDGSDDDDFSSDDDSEGDDGSDDEDGSSDDNSDGDGGSDDEDGSSDDESGDN